MSTVVTKEGGAVPRLLSYQRLLEITGKLPPDEQEYVLKFLICSDQKARKACQLAELERRGQRLAAQRLRDVRDKDIANERLTQRVNKLEKKVAGLRDELKRRSVLGKARTTGVTELRWLCQRIIAERLVDESRCQQLANLVDALTSLLTAAVYSPPATPPEEL